MHPASAPQAETVPSHVEAVRLLEVRMSYTLPNSLKDRVLRPFRAPRRIDALCGVNLTAFEGERIAVFGENGAGKTTLLKLIAGLLFPTAGRVLVAGRDTTLQGRHVRRDVGYVINEERSFYWRLTGLENLEFFGALENIFGRRAKDRMRELLARVGLEAHAQRRVAEYSAGMKQRLALARGLLTAPKILLLDEPTRSLDPLGTMTIHELLNQTVQERQTVIVATNRFEDAAALCKSVLILRHGKVAATGALDSASDINGVANFVRSELAALERG